MSLLQDWSHRVGVYLRAAYKTRSINWRGLPIIPKKFSSTIPHNRASYNEFLLWIRDHLRLPDARIIFDVGANHGVFAQAASTCFPGATVSLFEPLPTLHPFLKKLAACYGDRWRFYPLAFGASGGRLPFHVDPSDDGIGSFVGFSGSYDSLYKQSHSGLSAILTAKVIDVSIEALDDFCEREGIKHIDLIKIDVEGFEFEVLDGARRMLRNTTAIIVETSLIRADEGKPEPLRKMINRLTDYGLYIVGVFPSFIQQSNKEERPCEYNILARRFDT